MADTYSVERDIRIDAPPSAVYAQLVDFRRWRAWSPFEELDPGMDRTYSGAESGVGAAYEWSGNAKAGAGRLEIVEAVPDERVVVAQHSRKPVKSETETRVVLIAQGGGTVVTWTTTGKKTLAIRAVTAVRSMDALMGPMFEQGLAKLKLASEAAA